MKYKLLGKKWGELTEEIRKILLNKAAAVDGATGDRKIGNGDCIVDFEGTELSVAGKVVSTEYDYSIEIDDDAVLYTSRSLDNPIL